MKKQIKQDAKLGLTVDKNVRKSCNQNEITNVFLTGSTGFIGAYLCFYLLKTTTYHLYLLVNTPDESAGLARVFDNLEKYNLLQKCHAEHLKNRITILCGDLAKNNFGLALSDWHSLTNKIDCIYHNGAITHYLTHYDDLKASNVDGTKTIIKLAITERLKYIHYISTTLIFGWTPIRKLAENATNTAFKHVDFGYAESKWVAEQLIWQAKQLGVHVKIYRPAMVTASSEGQYTEKDIVARALTYLLNHQVTINLPNQISFIPVDEVAADIIAISLLENTKHDVYHLTAEYTNLPMICRYLTEQYHYQFNPLSLAEFNKHLQCHASEKDIIFPLVSFFNAHYKKIDKMHHKRYCRSNYLAALSEINISRKIYSLENTLNFIIQFLQKNKWIEKAYKPPSL